tara:strand:- start:459 stop:683 length:225 start_codon:yes stop_codon:yes gene_type:complete
MKVFELESGHYKLIKKLESWLLDSMHNKSHAQAEDLVMELVETLNVISHKGTYNQAEKQLLNKIRSQYLISEKE